MERLKYHQSAYNLTGQMTEVIWFGISNSLKKLSGTYLCPHIETDTISPTKLVRDLGVLLDNGMTTHDNKISGVCFYKL